MEYAAPQLHGFHERLGAKTPFTNAATKYSFHRPEAKCADARLFWLSKCASARLHRRLFEAWPAMYSAFKSFIRPT